MRFAQGGRAAGTSVVAAWLTASSTRLPTWPRNPPSSPRQIAPSSAAQGTSASLTRTRRAASACAAAVAAPLAAACASHQPLLHERPETDLSALSFYRSTSRACSWESVHGSCVHGLSLKTCMHMAEQLRAGPALRRSPLHAAADPAGLPLSFFSRSSGRDGAAGAGCSALAWRPL